MPLDPKYSSLPYIATGQPDVYESGDLPESDQQRDTKFPGNQAESGDVDQSSLDPAAAAAKFKGKQLDSSRVDFTDAIRAGRKIGYASGAVGDLELLDEAARDAETPMQKYRRLQAEIAGLSAAVEEARKSANNAGDGDSEVSPDQLAAMIRGAQSELLALHLDSLLGPEAEGLHVFDPEGCLEKRLAGQLERLGKQQPTAAAAAQGASGSLVYEVYTKPTSGAPAVPKDLEARLARLEAAVGEAHLRAPALSGDLAGRPLLEATHRLAGKLALLEPASLEQVDSRLAALNHRLAQLTSDKREPLADADTQARVAELYELVKKWDGLADSVHGIVGRLTALRELHEQAMQFSGALNLIDQSQRASSAQLESSASLLAGLEKRLTEDLKTVQANTASLQERMKALGK
ncbi:hypothetical protein BOX15_Mlig022266g1 [Macrostomum lignano]|uniref:Dynactin subunit 2 n=2 Tax=Macrostomum lignano TaxID=282301 RepID=A0A267H3B7_9PLAT|nr:hypothetical protein BOX15_Mlig022266g1 [Macrostomum lignano]